MTPAQQFAEFISHGVSLAVLAAVCIADRYDTFLWAWWFGAIVTWSTGVHVIASADLPEAEAAAFQSAGDAAWLLFWLALTWPLVSTARLVVLMLNGDPPDDDEPPSPTNRRSRAA